MDVSESHQREQRYVHGTSCCSKELTKLREHILIESFRIKIEEIARDRSLRLAVVDDRHKVFSAVNFRRGSSKQGDALEAGQLADHFQQRCDSGSQMTASTVSCQNVVTVPDGS